MTYTVPTRPVSAEQYLLIRASDGLRKPSSLEVQQQQQRLRAALFATIGRSPILAERLKNEVDVTLNLAEPDAFLPMRSLLKVMNIPPEFILGEETLLGGSLFADNPAIPRVYVGGDAEVGKRLQTALVFALGEPKTKDEHAEWVHNYALGGLRDLVTVHRFFRGAAPIPRWSLQALIEALNKFCPSLDEKILLNIFQPLPFEDMAGQPKEENGELVQLVHLANAHYPVACRVLYDALEEKRNICALQLTHAGLAAALQKAEVVCWRSSRLSRFLGGRSQASFSSKMLAIMLAYIGLTPEDFHQRLLGAVAVQA